MGFDVSNVKIPVHSFHGVRDRNVPIALVRAMLAHLPNATLTEFPEEGHLSSLCNQFEEVASRLRAASL